jgi:hypothetical protein
MNNLLTVDQLASLFDFVKASFDVGVPVSEVSVCALVLLLEGHNPREAVDLGLEALVNDHVTDFLLSSVFWNSD